MSVDVCVEVDASVEIGSLGAQHAEAQVSVAGELLGQLAIVEAHSQSAPSAMAPVLGSCLAATLLTTGAAAAK